MSLLTTQKISDEGLAPILVPASALGDRLSNAAGTMLYAKNTSGGVRNITVVVQNTDTFVEGFGNLTKTSNVVTLQDGEGSMIGPIPYAFQDIKSQVFFTYDNEVGLSVAAVLLPEPPVIIPQIAPGSLVCSTLSLSEGGGPPNNATSVINGNNAVVTNTAGGVNSLGIFDFTNTFTLLAAPEPVVLEIVIQEPSVVNDNGQMAIAVANTTFASFISGVQFAFGTGVDGVVSNVVGAPITSGLTYPTFPVVMHLEVSEDGTHDYVINDALGLVDSGSLPALSPPAGSASLIVGSIASAPDTISSSIDYVINGGSAPFVIPLVDPTAQPWCFFPFSSPKVAVSETFYSVTLPAGFALENSDTDFTFTHNGVASGTGFCDLGYQHLGSLPAGVVLNNNTFELELTQNLLNALESGTGNSITIGTGQDGFRDQIQLTYNSDNNNFDINLMNFSSVGSFTPSVGDIISATWLESVSATRLAYKSIATGVTTFYAAIPNAGNPPAQGAWCKMFMSTPQASGKIVLGFNGLLASMGITNYPTGYTDYIGGAITTAAETLDLIFEANPYINGTVGSTPTAVISGAGDNIVTPTTDGIGSGASFKCVSRIFTQGTTETFVIEGELTTWEIASGGELAGELGFYGLSESGPFVEMTVKRFNDKLILDLRDNFGASTKIDIVASGFNASAADGDVFGVEYDSAAQTVIGHYKPVAGIQVSTAPQAVPFPSIYMAQMTGSLSASKSEVWTQRFNSADMTLAYAAGAKDLLLVLV